METILDVFILLTMGLGFLLFLNLSKYGYARILGAYYEGKKDMSPEECIGLALAWVSLFYTPFYWGYFYNMNVVIFGWEKLSNWYKYDFSTNLILYCAFYCGSLILIPTFNALFCIWEYKKYHENPDRGAKVEGIKNPIPKSFLREERRKRQREILNTDKERTKEYYETMPSDIVDDMLTEIKKFEKLIESAVVLWDIELMSMGIGRPRSHFGAGKDGNSLSGHTFIAEKDMQAPALCGASAVAVIIPKGIKIFPADDTTHSYYYDLNDENPEWKYCWELRRLR